MKIRRSNSSGMIQNKSTVQTTGKKKRLEQQLLEQQFLKIYLRIRPINVHQNIYDVNSDCKSVKVKDQQEFGFNHVFDEMSSQQQIFENVCKPALTEMFYKQNSNSLIFTYGVTNSGKTYTTFGNIGCPGILPNLLYLVLQIRDKIRTGDRISLYPDLNIENDNVFDRLVLKDNSAKELASDLEIDRILNTKNGYLQSIDVYLEAFEIYNEQIKDLSQPKHCVKNPPSKELQQTRLTTTGQIQSYLKNALNNRTISSTRLNQASSRAHTVFRILIRFDYEQNSSKELHLSVCDLAGSERADRSGNLGSKLKEASSINKSLMTLNKCIFALVKKERVPYRESKLTKLLCEYFKDCNNNLIMIANINPHQLEFDETLRVLNFTSLAKKSHPIKTTIDQSWKFNSSNKIRTLRKSSSLQLINPVQDSQQLTIQQLQEQKQELEAIFEIYRVSQNFKLQKAMMHNQLQKQKQQNIQPSFDNIFKNYLDQSKSDPNFFNDNILQFSDSFMEQIEKFAECETSEQLDQTINDYLKKPNMKICNNIIRFNFNGNSKINQQCSPVKWENLNQNSCQNTPKTINPINKSLYGSNQRSFCKKMFESVKKEGQTSRSKDKKYQSSQIKYKKHSCNNKAFQI